jgi:hypothetical protein
LVLAHRTAEDRSVFGIDRTPKAHYGSGVSFRDPYNIALEFFIAPGT